MFTTSSKGKPILVVDGHEFFKKREGKSTTWNCSQYQKLKCRATATSIAEHVLEVRGEHVHEPKFGKPEARKVIAESKTRSEQLTPSVAVSSSILPMTNDNVTQLSLPSKGSLTQMSRRKRQENNLVEEKNPINRQFTLPESFCDFLIADTGSEDLERILVFGDKDLVNLLQGSKQWLADGTFKLSPTLFYQLYTIHAQIGHSAPACVYALLPNKSEKTYSRMIELISPSIPDASHSRILLDFEQAPMNAFQKIFPSAQMSGCKFHLCQSFNRRINELGLKKVYENKPELALALRCPPALAFEDKGKKKEHSRWSLTISLKYATAKTWIWRKLRKLMSCAAISRKHT